MQFPLQIRVWTVPRHLRDWSWPQASRARPAMESGAAFLAGCQRLLRALWALSARIDVDWVIGTAVWTVLVYVVIRKAML
jgi:hypothetical protein